MVRPQVLVASALLFAACQTTEPLPERLAVRDTFPVAYEGSISPLVAEDAAAFGGEPEAAAAKPVPSVSFRATVVELPLSEAAMLVPDLLAGEPPATEELPDGGVRTWAEERVTTTAGDGVKAVHRMRGVGLAAGHVDPAALRSALDAMARQDRVRQAPHGAVGVGGTVTVNATTQRAFVKSMHLTASADSFFVDDIEVATFEHGSQLRFAARPEGDALRIDIEWLESTPALPLPVARVHASALQVPVLARHRVKASTCVGASDGLVLASLPGDAPGSVKLLCVEVDAEPQAVAAR